MHNHLPKIQNRPARRSGKHYLTGSSITIEEPQMPAQEPPIPLHQLQPSHADIVKAEDAIQPRRVVRDGKSKPAPKPFVKPITTRKRYRLSRRNVAALLDKPGVTEALPRSLCAQYQALAAGNVSLEELAAKHHLGRIAMESVVEGWESDIVLKVCQLFPKFHPWSSEPDNDQNGQIAENESESAQDADIANTGGESIGGRIISRGSKSAPGKEFQNEKLDTFERSGRIHGTESARPASEDRSGSKVSEEDNYGEDSGDDIPRSD
jgi:hypothetical protein